jgi:hypothetical protein
MYIFEVHGLDEFRTYLYTVRGRFSVMLQAMLDVKDLIKANTNQRVPLDTGRLEESYQYKIVEYNRNFIEVEVGYDAVDPDSDFHYAEYQHNLPTSSHYKKANRKGQMRGEQYYLYKGIQASESMAYELIEMDYLSMFDSVGVR